MVFCNLAASVRDLTDKGANDGKLYKYGYVQDGNNIMLINMHFSIESEVFLRSQNKSKKSMLLWLKIREKKKVKKK